MAGSVNRVTLVGRLGADPEVRNFQSGGSVCNLRVATSESWRDKQSGEKKERTEWHNVTVQQEGAIKFAEQYLRKGDLVYVEGQIRTRKWKDRDGNDRYSTEIAIVPYRGELQSMSSRDGGSGGSERREEGSRGGGSSSSGGYGGGGRPGGGYSDMDDEIPFCPEIRA